jgi:formate dehydrogenase accessory protein FdhE
LHQSGSSDIVERMILAADPWERHIERAAQLIAAGSAARSLLEFYVDLLRQQRRLYETSKTLRLAGPIDTDVTCVAESATALLATVADRGPDALAADARSLLESGRDALADALLDYWQHRSDHDFFAKAIVQPYAARLAEVKTTRFAGSPTPAENRCPRCDGAAQLSILDAAGALSVDGSVRRLLCATCLTTWAFRRVVCPSCGEEDERKLAYFQSPEADHLRVDACDSCRRYLKTIDLGRLGLADPLVDEIAGAALDIWARDRGYEKIELNLVGL